jgi:hypothetical protein
MTANKHSFDDLEKQLARDALEQALKDLHGVINKEIENNKAAFSQEIQKTLASFKQTLEKNVSEEIDKKLSSLFENNFRATSQDVKTSFEKAFAPVLENTQNNMKRLHGQGEDTLKSWQHMMSQYKSLWTRPFLIVFAASILTGVVVSFLFSYYLTRHIRETMQTHESIMLSYKDLAAWYFEKDKTREEKVSKSSPPAPANKKKK